MKTLRSNPPRPLDIRSNWEWDESRFLAEMDRWQVSMQVLSLPHVYEYYDPENRAFGVELCRCANDEYGEICARRPERFRFFAAPPLPDVERACTELDRAKAMPGFSGITLSTNLHERTLDDPDFASFFEHANAAGVVIFLHPLQRPFPKEWYVYRLDHLIGLPVDTTFTLARLALCGFFDHYPNIKIIAAHVGGARPVSRAAESSAPFAKAKANTDQVTISANSFTTRPAPPMKRSWPRWPECSVPNKSCSAPTTRSVSAKRASSTSNTPSASFEDSGLSETDLAKIFSANARQALAHRRSAPKRTIPTRSDHDSSRIRHRRLSARRT